MKCTQCKDKMKCVDTREQDGNKTRRKWLCNACNLQGYTHEAFITKLEPRRKYKTVLDVEADRLLRKIGIAKVSKPKATKKHKELLRNQRAREPIALSGFDDMEEDYAPDFTDLGVDIPHTDNW